MALWRAYLPPMTSPSFLIAQTPCLTKAALLYGLDQRVKPIPQDQVVIVEGYLDVIALHQVVFFSRTPFRPWAPR